LPNKTNKRNTPGDKPGVLRYKVLLVSVTVLMTVAVLVFLGRLVDNRGLCRQDAQGPTPPTFSIVMRVRYPGGASVGGKLPPARNIAVFSSLGSSGAPPSSPNRTLG
jgi:hypothetical protein